MMKRIYLTILIFITSTGLTQVDVNGYFKSFNALLLEGKNDYLVLRNRLRLNFDYFPSEHAYGFASLDFKNDGINDVSSLETSVRELYIDLYFNSVDLRIGKQQIVWGEADGLFITDIVNPLDLREFILPDFEDIRIGTNAIKLQTYWGENRFESVWIPDFVPAKFASIGEPWSFRSPIDEIAETLPDSLIAVTPIGEPEPVLKNSEYGFRYSTFLKGVDFTLSYFRTWDDYPVFRQTYHAIPNPFVVTITPEYSRYNVIGGTFSTNIGSLVIRGESALYQNRNFYTTDISDADRVAKKDFLNYMIGGEISPGDAFISGQFIQEIILDYDNLLVSEEVINTATLLVTHSFANETVKPEFFTIYNLTREDYLLRLNLKLYPADGLEVILATDILGGEQVNTLFGQFDKNDNVYFKVKYSF